MWEVLQRHTCGKTSPLSEQFFVHVHSIYHITEFQTSKSTEKVHLNLFKTVKGVKKICSQHHSTVMQVRSKLGEVNAQFNGDNEAAEKWQNWVALDKSLYLASFVKCYIRGSSCATKTHYTTYIHQDSWQELGNEGCLWNTLSLYLEEMVHLQVFPENKGEISFNHCALGLRRLLYFRVSWQKFILTIYTGPKIS